MEPMAVHPNTHTHTHTMKLGYFCPEGKPYKPQGHVMCPHPWAPLFCHLPEEGAAATGPSCAVRRDSLPWYLLCSNLISEPWNCWPQDLGWPEVWGSRLFPWGGEGGT